VDASRKADTVSRKDQDPKQRHKRGTFTKEFKAEAVKLVLDEHKPASAVAFDLDLTESSVRMWVAQTLADRGAGKPGALTPGQEGATGAAAQGEPRAQDGAGDPK
jgi:transposase-like protein